MPNDWDKAAARPRPGDKGYVLLGGLRLRGLPTAEP
jgi:hypothetical protein